jgi:DNA replication and repair protein RecF
VFIKSLKIRNFRNLEKIDLDCNELISYFYSPNGTGKTNLLEAVQCLSVGKSLRATAEQDLADYQSVKPKSVLVQASLQDEDGLESSQTFAVEFEPKKKKTLLINKTKTSINHYVGRVPSIWFSPESIKIINSSPKSKRKYFDDILIQLYPEYMYDLRYYNKALQNRNKLLQDDVVKLGQMRVWTEQLILYGSKIIKTRQKFFALVNEYFDKLDELPRYKFRVEFEPSITLNEVFDEDAKYNFHEALRERYQSDRRRGTTTCGPHRDDWNMLIQIHEEAGYIRADKFASRGQQRMALIMLQMVLIRIFQKNLDRKPILLLDDIFSELDEENEKLLVNFILHNTIQSFITGVDKKEFGTIAEVNLREVM